MGLFKEVPKPVCGSNPTDAAGMNELLDFARARDPIGDKTHNFFACLFFLCLPVATAPASIAMAALVLQSIVRIPATWRVLLPLFLYKTYIIVLMWGVWSTVSILWSTNQIMGFDHASSMWSMALLLPLLLFPVIRRWKLLLGCFFIGVCFQNMSQVGQLILPHLGFEYNTFFPEPKSHLRPSGLTSHPGNSTIFMAFSVLTWMMILMTIQKLRILAIVGISLGLFGIVVAQSRGVWVSFACGAGLLCFLAVRNKIIPLQKLAIIAVTLVTVTAVSSSFVFSNMTKRIQEVPTAINGFFSENEVKTGTQIRLNWWKAEFNQSFESPLAKNLLIGHGLGSSSEVEHYNGSQSASHPHNAFVQILYECGLVGITLFVWMIISIGCSLKTKQWTPAKIVLLSATLCWALVAIFDGGQNSGRVLALMATLVCINILLGFQLLTPSSRKPSIVTQ